MKCAYFLPGSGPGNGELAELAGLTELVVVLVFVGVEGLETATTGRSVTFALSPCRELVLNWASSNFVSTVIFIFCAVR